MSALVNMSIMSRWKWSVVLIVPASTFFFIVVRSIGLKFKAKDHKTKRENSFFNCHQIDMSEILIEKGTRNDTTRRKEMAGYDFYPYYTSSQKLHFPCIPSVIKP